MGTGDATPSARRGLRAVLVSTAGVVVLAIAGCGSSSSAAGPTTTPSASISTTVSPGGTGTSATPSATTAGDDCGGAVDRVKTAVSSFPQVTDVQAIAACHEVDIDTNLPSGVLGSPSATKGTAICTAAAKVAYQGDVSSITVSDTDGHELATGLSSSPCIPG